MNCPFCHKNDTKVVDSRLLNDSNAVRRRRKCEICKKRFTTMEVVQISMPMVVKNDGRREDYSREKIYDGIQKACQKRPVSTDHIERVVDNIERTLLELNDKEVSTREIGNLIMEYLRVLDPVAYVRFASVYKTFTDVDEFVRDLKDTEDHEGPHP